jgi:hypothetical protein
MLVLAIIIGLGTRAMAMGVLLMVSTFSVVIPTRGAIIPIDLIISILARIIVALRTAIPACCINVAIPAYKAILVFAIPA